jgi:hypothetical protein
MPDLFRHFLLAACANEPDGAMPFALPALRKHKNAASKMCQAAGMLF